MLVSVRVASTTKRQTISVDSEETIQNIFSQAEIGLDGDVSVNASGFNVTNFETKLSAVPGIDLSAQTIFLTATINSKNA